MCVLILTWCSTSPITHPTTLSTNSGSIPSEIVTPNTPIQWSWSQPDSWSVIPDYLDITIDWSGLQFDRILDQNSSYTRYQISYLSNGLRISWIMNIPVWDGPYPLIILNHGYIDPAIYTIGRGLRREQDYLARNGYAVLHTDYRNHGWSDTDPNWSDYEYMRSKYYGIDALNAIQAVRQAILDTNPIVNKIDANRVWMLWHSMWGGVTMYGLVARPDMVDAAVLYAPVHSDEYNNFQRWMNNRITPAQRQTLSGTLWWLTSDSFAPISPQTYFDRIDDPVQIYFGTSDDSCPIQRWRDIRDALVVADKSVTLIEYPWEEHEFWPQWWSFMKWVVEFFDQEVAPTASISYHSSLSSVGETIRS